MVTLIIGKSGTGKSRSIINLPADKTGVINVNGKPLPFRGWKANYKAMNKEGGNMLVLKNDPEDYQRICNGIGYINKNFTVGIIDDFQYVMANEFMRRAKETGFQKFTDIGCHAWEIVHLLSSSPIHWFVLSHSETSDAGETKAKTIGKLLDDKICLEGMFSMVLNTVVEDGKFYFETQNNGQNTSKSPEGMFDSVRIPNDLEYVISHINKYEGE